MDESRPEIFVGICVPSQETWKTDMARSMVMMTSYFMTAPMTKEDGSNVTRGFTLICEKGSVLPQQRNTMARIALTGGCTHVLWMDSDMSFPADTLNRLLSHGVDVVGCNCPRKSIPSRPTASLGIGKPVITRRVSSGLQTVAHVGTGVMLMKTGLFLKMEEPWFNFMWAKGPDVIVGEDVRLCRQLRALGHDIWIDHDLSKEIRHVGEWDYRHDQVPGFYEPEPEALPLAEAAE